MLQNQYTQGVPCPERKGAPKNHPSVDKSASWLETNNNDEDFNDNSLKDTFLAQFKGCQMVSSDMMLKLVFG